MSLELRNVKKAYREPNGGRVPVLIVANFKVAAGEQVVLIGSSGGGKTTLLNVIAGITTADSGRSCGFRPRYRQTVGKFSRSISCGANRVRVSDFQPASRIYSTRNVLLGMSFGGQKADRVRAIKLLERVGLGHRLHHKPMHMSVGEQQRTSVARALVNTPRLLLADEPTANVDPANQQTVLQLLRDSCREHNVSLLLVTHAQEVAAQFDRVENSPTSIVLPHESSWDGQQTTSRAVDLRKALRFHAP